MANEKEALVRDNNKQKKNESYLPLLPEDERTYLNVPYVSRGFAKCTHCGFDGVKKLWFTGLQNTKLQILIQLYGVNSATSHKMLNLLNEKFGNKE